MSTAGSSQSSSQLNDEVALLPAEEVRVSITIDSGGNNTVDGVLDSDRGRDVILLEFSVPTSINLSAQFSEEAFKSEITIQRVADGQPLFSDRRTSDFVFRDELYFEAGAYWLSVHSRTALIDSVSYQLNLQAEKYSLDALNSANELEPNDFASAANLLSYNSVFQGNLSKSDSDYLSFVVPETGGVIGLRLVGSLDYIRLLDSEFRVLERIESKQPSFRAEFGLAAGQYYVDLQGIGKYKLKLSNKTFIDPKQALKYGSLAALPAPINITPPHISATRTDSIELAVDSMALQSQYSGVLPSRDEFQFLVLDMSITVVPANGTDLRSDPISFFSHSVNGPFLHWNGAQIIGLQPDMSALDLVFQDPSQLFSPSDQLSAQLVFEVPKERPKSGAALVLPYKKYGSPTIELFKNSPEFDFAADDFASNGLFDVKVDDFEVTPEGVRVIFSGFESKTDARRALNATENEVSNLSNTVLFVDSNRIRPIHSMGTSPVVFLSERITQHTVWFPTENAMGATDIGLVFALPPVKSANSEPYWIVPLRGTPSIANLPDPFGGSKRANNTKQATPAKLTSTVRKPHAPPWPAKPSAPRSFIDAEKLSLARRESQDFHAALPDVVPGTETKTALELQLEEVVTAGFDTGKAVHFYKLPLLSPEQRAEIHLLNDVKTPLRMELLFQNEQGDWQLAMRRGSDIAIQQLRLDTQYLLSVEGSKAPSRYSLGIYNTGRGLSDESFEPSDSASLPSLETWVLSRDVAGKLDQIEWFGRFDSLSDTDYFRLLLPEPALATLEISPTAKISLFSDSGEIGRSKIIDKRSILADVLVSAGETIFAVNPKNGLSIGDYAVKTTLYPLPEATSELEPNDKNEQAHRLIPGIARGGRLPTKDDKDNYFFDWPGPGNALIEVDGEDADSYRVDVSAGTNQIKLDKVGGAAYRVQLPKGHYQIRLSSRSLSLQPYSLQLSHAPLIENEKNDDVALIMQLQKDRLSLKSYADLPQAMDVVLQLSNPGTDTQSIQLSAQIAHSCCQINFDRTELLLEGGQSQDLKFTVFAKRDSASEGPFPIDIYARYGDDIHSIRLWVEFSDNAAASYRDWQDYPLPAELMGAWDVARLDFGAYPVQRIECVCNAPINTKKSVKGVNPYSLDSDVCAAAIHAGAITTQGGVIEARLSSLQTSFPAEENNGVKSRQSGQAELSILIGESNLTTNTSCPTRFKLSDSRVDFLLSGLPVVNKARVANSMEFVLAAESAVVGFVLNTMGANRQVKDLAISLSVDGREFTEVIELSLAQSKGSTPVVLDNPTSARFVRLDLLNGFPPFDNADGFMLDGLKVLASNITDPIFSGGANLAQPQLGFEVFSQDSKNTTVAFHHKRRADIEAVTLFNEDKTEANVSLYASVAGPYGPWLSIGTLLVQPGTEATLALTSATGVRYLSLRTDEGNLKKMQIRQIREKSGTPDYRSILTEWGGESSLAGHEWLGSNAPLNGEILQSSENAPQTAVVGNSFNSEVSLRNAQEDFYRVSMPAIGSDLQLNFKGDPFFRARVEVRTPTGEVLPLPTLAKKGNQIVSYTVPNNGAYDFVNVRVHDTPRHLAVLWDDSGSVATFIPGVLKLLGNMAFSLDSNWERLQLTPLHKNNDGFITESWTADPYEIAGAIRRYRKSGSSSSYLTLDHALDALADVDGMRALLILTDERGDRKDYPNNAIEKKLASVAPTVFSFHMAAGVALHDAEINHMQAWAGISGGRYTMLQSPDEIPQAFAKVQGWLRKPVGYQLSVKAITTLPGQLSVSYAPGKQANSGSSLGAVEVIFDASGSMWKKLGDGSPRITVARKVLTDLVQNTLPENTPFALRVFGHREPKSCRTDLELPLGALEKSTALKKISNIDPQDRSRTPIAASLTAVEQDLRNVQGQRLVLLITDGEETCDGDPEAAINALIADGIDLQINIVGFAIDDESLKQDFKRWASLGGGDYFNADSAEQLKESLTESLQPRYEVKDSNGSTVGSGRVGDGKISLPSGNYQVFVGKEMHFENVFVKGGEFTSLLLNE